MKVERRDATTMATSLTSTAATTSTTATTTTKSNPKMEAESKTTNGNLLKTPSGKNTINEKEK